MFLVLIVIFGILLLLSQRRVRTRSREVRYQIRKSVDCAPAVNKYSGFGTCQALNWKKREDNFTKFVRILDILVRIETNTAWKLSFLYFGDARLRLTVAQCEA